MSSLGKLLLYTVANLKAASNYTDLHLSLFSWSDYSWTGKMNVYSVKIYGTDGNILAYMIPCQKSSDNTVGLYDIVRDNYYPAVTGGGASGSKPVSEATLSISNDGENYNPMMTGSLDDVAILLNKKQSTVPTKDVYYRISTNGECKLGTNLSIGEKTEMILGSNNLIISDGVNFVNYGMVSGGYIVNGGHIKNNSLMTSTLKENTGNILVNMTIYMNGGQFPTWNPESGDWRDNGGNYSKVLDSTFVIDSIEKPITADNSKTFYRWSYDESTFNPTYSVVWAYKITIEWGEDGEGPVGPLYFECGSKINIASDLSGIQPTKEPDHYSFGKGFSFELNGEKINHVFDLDENKTLYAVWNGEPHTITLVSEGKKVGEVQSVYGSVLPPVEIPVNGNNIFMGYYLGSTDVDENRRYGPDGTGDVSTFTTDETLIAKWIDHNIVLSKNTSDEHDRDGYAFIKKDASSCTGINNAIKIGYSIEGYYLDEGCTDGKKVLDAKGKVINGWSHSTGVVTLYAKWIENEYSIAFDGNGSEGTMEPITEIGYSSVITLTKNTFSKYGYRFIGWSTTPTGEAIYGDEKEVEKITSKNGDTVILYAKWEAIEYTIFFDGNGADIQYVKETKLTMDSPIGNLAEIPVRYGYEFQGYYLNDGESSKMIYDSQGKGVGKWTIAEDSTLVAVWKAHDLTHHDRVEPVKNLSGSIEYWECSSCGHKYSDEGCRNIVTDVVIWLDPTMEYSSSTMNAGEMGTWAFKFAANRYLGDNSTLKIDILGKEDSSFNVVMLYWDVDGFKFDELSITEVDNGWSYSLERKFLDSIDTFGFTIDTIGAYTLTLSIVVGSDSEVISESVNFDVKEASSLKHTLTFTEENGKEVKMIVSDGSDVVLPYYGVDGFVGWNPDRYGLGTTYNAMQKYTVDRNTTMYSQDTPELDTEGGIDWYMRYGILFIIPSADPEPGFDPGVMKDYENYTNDLKWFNEDYTDIHFGTRIIDGVERGVTHIGFRCFIMANITSVVIPDTVEYIGGDAFWGIDTLETITIGSGLRDVGNGPFVKCPNVKEYIIPNNEHFVTIDGLLIQMDREGGDIDGRWGLDSKGNEVYVDAKYYPMVVQYANAYPTTDKILKIPDYVRSINYYSMYESPIDQVVFGVNSECISISHEAFCASEISAINIPDSMTTIGYQAFGGCKNLSSIELNNVRDMGTRLVNNTDSELKVTKNDVDITQILKDLDMSRVLLDLCSTNLENTSDDPKKTSVMVITPDSTITLESDLTVAENEMLVIMNGAALDVNGKKLTVDGILRTYGNGALSDYSAPFALGSKGSFIQDGNVIAKPGYPISFDEKYHMELTHSSTGWDYHIDGDVLVKNNITVNVSGNDTFTVNGSICIERALTGGNNNFTISGKELIIDEISAKRISISSAKDISLNGDIISTVSLVISLKSDDVSVKVGNLNIASDVNIIGEVDVTESTLTGTGKIYADTIVSDHSQVIKRENTTGSITIKEDGRTWTYGSNPTLAVEGDVEGRIIKYYYSKTENGTYTTVVPTDVGEYYVYAEVEPKGDLGRMVTPIVKCSIIAKDITSEAVRLIGNVFTYDGKKHGPSAVMIGNLSVMDYVTEGLTATEPGEYTVKIVGEGNFTGETTATWKIVVAKIGESNLSYQNSFISLESALGGCSSDGIITLIADAECKSSVTFSGKATLDMNGFDVTWAEDCSLTIEKDGILKITNSGKGKMSATSSESTLISCNGDLTIFGGTYHGTITNVGGKISLDNGSFSVKPDDSWIPEGKVVESVDGMYLVLETVTEIPTVIIDDWTYGNESSVPTLGANAFKDRTVTFEYSKDDGTELGFKPADAGNYKVKAHVGNNSQYASFVTDWTSFKIEQRELILLDKTIEYDGTTLTGTIEAIGANGSKVTVTYTADSTEVGTYAYKVGFKATIDDQNYKLPASSNAKFIITEAGLVTNVILDGWTYGDQANTPNLSKNPDGAHVDYYYDESPDGDFTTTEQPTVAGTYYVKAVIAASDHYVRTVTDPVAFVISKAASTIVTDNIRVEVQDGEVLEIPVVLRGPGIQPIALSDVVVTFGDVVLATVTTDENGEASFIYDTASKIIPAGQYQHILFSYAGDRSIKPTTTPISVLVVTKTVVTDDDRAVVDIDRDEPTQVIFNNSNSIVVTVTDDRVSEPVTVTLEIKDVTASSGIKGIHKVYDITIDSGNRDFVATVTISVSIPYGSTPVVTSYHDDGSVYRTEKVVTWTSDSVTFTTDHNTLFAVSSYRQIVEDTDDDWYQQWLQQYYQQLAEQQRQEQILKEQQEGKEKDEQMKTIAVAVAATAVILLSVLAFVTNRKS